MTCDEFGKRLDGWLAGALPELKARAMEDHAGQCVACYAQLDAASRPRNIPRRLATPAGLREATLAAVARRRRVVRWRRGAYAVAATVALLFVASLFRPSTKMAVNVPGGTDRAVAMEHAQPALAALDAAESEIEDALRTDPENPLLVDALARIHQRRDELNGIVREVGS